MNDFECRNYPAWCEGPAGREEYRCWEHSSTHPRCLSPDKCDADPDGYCASCHAKALP